MIDCYVPSQTASLMTEIRPRFTMNSVKSEEILNFSGLWPSFLEKITCLPNENLGNKVPRSKNVTFQPLAYMMFTHSKEHLGALRERPFIPEHTFVLSLNRWGTTTSSCIKIRGNNPSIRRQS